MKRITTLLLVLLLTLAPLAASFTAKAAKGEESGDGEAVRLTESQAAELKEKGYLATDSAEAQITISEDEYRHRTRLTEASKTIRTGDASVLSLAQTVSETGMFKDNYTEGTWQRQFYEGIEAAVLDGSLTSTTPNATVKITVGNMSSSELWSAATENWAYFNIMHAVMNDYMGYFNWAENSYGLGAAYSSGTTCLVAKFYASGFYKTSMDTTAKGKVSEAVAYAKKGSTRYDQVKNVYTWLCENCEYDYDSLSVNSDTEDFFFAHSQLGLLTRGKGVCETYAKTAKIIFYKLGIPCVIVTSDMHAFNYVKMEDDCWYLFDATWGDQSWGIYEKYLLSSNNPYIDDDHTEDDMHEYPKTATVNYLDRNQCSHSYTSETVKNASCSEEGLIRKTCSRCGDVVETRLEKTAHTPGQETETARKEPTLTETGYITYTISCTKCGAKISRRNETLAKKQLATPSDIKTSNGLEGVKVSWTAVEGAPLYKVYRRDVSVEGSAYKSAGNSTTTDFVDKTAESGKTYAYTVRCVTADGKTAVSGYDKNGSQILFLASPVMSTANTTAGAKASWTAIEGAAGYYVYRRTSDTSYVKIASVTDTSYTDAAAQSGTTYTYCAKAYKGKTTSSYKGKSLLYLAPLVTKNLTLSNTAGGIKVTWIKVTGARGYCVYRRTGSGDYKLIKTISDGETVTYTDTSIASNNGTAYTYCVRAFSGNTKGSYSGKSIYRLSTTSISSITNTTGCKITLNWAKNAAATGYQIQYSLSSSFASGNTSLNVAGASTLSKTTAALTKGKTYYVRIRVYKTNSAGNSYYSAWSAAKSVKVSK